MKYPRISKKIAMVNGGGVTPPAPTPLYSWSLDRYLMTTYRFFLHLGYSPYEWSLESGDEVDEVPKDVPFDGGDAT
jgi:hypothetical protein